MALLAGTTLFAACSGSGSQSAMDSAKADSAAFDSVKLVKTAEMKFKVKNALLTGEQISKLTRECGGIVMHHNLQTQIVSKQDINMGNDSIKRLTVSYAAADMIVKIPAELVEPFMDSLNHMGVFVDTRKMDIEDKSLDYLATKLKVQNREASVKLRKGIKLTQRGADSILSIKDDAVDRKISNLRTDDASKFTMLNLNLYQNNSVNKEVLANEDLSNYNTSLGVQTSLAFSNGWKYFAQLMVGVLHLWAFILAGGAVWFGIWYYHKRKNQNKTLPSP